MGNGFIIHEKMEKGKHFFYKCQPVVEGEGEVSS